MAGATQEEIAHWLKHLNDAFRQFGEVEDKKRGFATSIERTRTLNQLSDDFDRAENWLRAHQVPFRYDLERRAYILIE